MKLTALTATTLTPKQPQPQPQQAPPKQHQHQHQTKPTKYQRISLSTKTNPVDVIVSWTSSISRRCQSGQLPEAAAEFTRMRLSGVTPNHITFITLLSGCADFPLESEFFGALLHGYVRKLGLVGDNVMVGTAVIGMYVKFGRIGLARLVFDAMEVKNSVSWNTMIDGYMRYGEVDDAIKLFDEMPVRDKISWTALINGFVKNGRFEQALECFSEMLISEVEPDYVTMIAVLSACANLGALGLGCWIHRFVLEQDFKNNVRVSNSLVDMYARCGCVDFARQVFEKMPKRTLVSWNSIMVGFAANGLAEEALEYFDLMQKYELKPDGVSFTGALTACSHTGLVDEGLRYFNIMKRVYRISPRIEHYGCVVDLYSRAGRLEEAMRVIENMPMMPNAVVVGSLLAACRTRGDINFAERLMKYLVELDPSIDSNYVLLANMYAAVGRWDGSGKIRAMMKALGIQKKPGISSIEIGCSIHEFVAGDKSHIDTECIYATLQLLSIDLKICGYMPETIVRELYEND
ncbi:PPR domain-containing protein/PPR_1 domain-containing protein/PPR_2 domain-containing protein [Cephalotus follicularis]|uniref:PPR domain-containing protein/PPR_1 domain-containing protein/PPR_2 domain-containing protein n=1 Tax=Cephalotus follicularis TaxID=3775 RepID=A0A1Q3D4I1_CEPFO|nr:PPR domain-containing protein/PPR_1 domain-containing protein/PPR_2 domain-containing protein [Cephalotus follicularis]